MGSSGVRITAIVRFFDAAAIVSEHLLEVVNQLLTGGVDFNIGLPLLIFQRPVDGIDPVWNVRICLWNL